MAQLDCGVENCVYNKCKSCCKGDITVGGKHAESRGDTCCESFSGKRAGDSYISALEHHCHTISIATACITKIINVMQNMWIFPEKVHVSADRHPAIPSESNRKMIKAALPLSGRAACFDS